MSRVQDLVKGVIKIVYRLQRQAQQDIILTTRYLLTYFLNSSLEYYYNDYIFDCSIRAAATSSISSTTPQNQNHYYKEYHEGTLEIANSLLKILTNQIADNTMVAAVKEKWR